jgi:hypothetical protein
MREERKAHKGARSGEERAIFRDKNPHPEGDTEKLAFPEYAKALGIDLDQAGATIIEVEGKRNPIEFVQQRHR